MNFISKKELFLLFFYSFFSFAISASDGSTPLKTYVVLSPELAAQAPIAGGQLEIGEKIGSLASSITTSIQNLTPKTSPGPVPCIPSSSNSLIVKAAGFLWSASKLTTKFSYNHPYIASAIALTAADGILFLQFKSEIEHIKKSKNWIIGGNNITTIDEINGLNKGQIINYFSSKSDLKNIGVEIILTPPCDRDRALDYLNKEIQKIDNQLLSLKKWTPFEKYSNKKILDDNLLINFKKEFSFEFPISILTSGWPIQFCCPYINLDQIKSNLLKLKTLVLDLGYDSKIISIDVKLPWIYGVFGLMNITSDLAFELLLLKKCYNKFIDKINS